MGAWKNPIQKLKIKTGSKTEKTEPNEKDIESQKLKTQERKIIKEEQKSQSESVKTPDSKKKKKNNDSPRSPVDECKNISLPGNVQEEKLS